jgi:hypothetical protein
MSARAAYHIKLAVSARASCCSGALAAALALDAADRPGRRGRGNSPAPLAGPQELVHFLVRANYWCVHWRPIELVAGPRAQCPGSNSTGRVVGPVTPTIEGHGAGPVRRRLGMCWVITVSA